MPNPPRDYYEVLGVPRDADAKTIKESFRKLALQYHPDRNKQPGAEEKFKEIAEAYAVLSDPAKRAAFDSGGFAGVSGASPEDLYGDIDFGDIFGGLGFDFGGGGRFERLFRRRARAGPRPGGNVEVELAISLDRVASGGNETVRLRRPVSCAACKGTGSASGAPPQPCRTCHGSGRQVSGSRRGGVTFQQVSACSSCQGRGSVLEKPCRECAGRGAVEREEALSVKIPPGIDDGMALRVAGHGMPSDEPGGPAGDLFVVLRTTPDARFERNGTDLWRVEKIDIPDAVLGGTLAVPTLDGSATVRVPAGTQSGAVLRLRGKGLPVFGGRGHGDLYLRLEVRVPDRLASEERKLYEKLREVGRKKT